MPVAETLTAACLALGAARLTAADLARADRAFALLPPERVLAWAPTPGVRRWLDPDELRRWAPESTLAKPLCIERAARPLERAALEAALREALGAEAAFELLDWARQPLPAGRLSFDRRALPAPRSSGDAPLLWRGALEDADRRRYPLWARVRWNVTHPAVRLRAPAASGEAVAAEQLELATAPGPAPPPHQAFPPFATLEDAAGCRVRRALAAGTILTRANCRPPSAVERGDDVTVSVASGSTALALTARAQTAGQPGDLVWLENPTNHRRFRARVSGPRRAQIISESSVTP